INNNGGIKGLGGATIEIVYADAGDNTEKAKNAAQRLLADQPDLVGGTGAWLSSFTLAVTARVIAVADPQLFRRDHQSRVQIRLPDVPDRRPPGGRDGADRAQTGGKLHGQGSEDGRDHYGQHCSAGELRQAAEGRRAREDGAQTDRRPGVHTTFV